MNRGGVDLHIHTTASDGTDSPSAIVDLAAKAGITTIAITDHDTMIGVPEAADQGQKLGVHVIPGIEISAGFTDQSIHILGLGITQPDTSFKTMIATIQDGRKNRNPRIVQRLNQLGLDITVNDVKACAGGDVIGRLHIAQAMVNKGIVKTVDNAFRQYLERGAKAYVERFRPKTTDAVAMIKNAGGIPIIAHPGLMKFSGLNQLKRYLVTLKEMGIEGLETHYPCHPPEIFNLLNTFATENNMVVSGGSDYHGMHKYNRLGLGFQNSPIETTYVQELLNRLSIPAMSRTNP